MADAAAGDVDAALVPEAGHKERCLVRVVAVAPGTVIEVERTDLRADGVALDVGGGSAHGVATEGAVGLVIVGGVVGVEAHLAVAVGVGDVRGDDEAEREPAAGDGRVAAVDRVRVVRVGVCLACAIVVEGSDLFFAVEDDGSQGAVEVGHHCAVHAEHFTRDRYAVEGAEVDGRSVRDRLSVHLGNADFVTREGECQGRVADEDEAAIEVRRIAVFHLHHHLSQGRPTAIAAAAE